MSGANTPNMLTSKLAPTRDDELRGSQEGQHFLTVIFAMLKAPIPHVFCVKDRCTHKREKSQGDNANGTKERKLRT